MSVRKTQISMENVFEFGVELQINKEGLRNSKNTQTKLSKSRLSRPPHENWRVTNSHSDLKNLEIPFRENYKQKTDTIYKVLFEKDQNVVRPVDKKVD